MKGGGAGLITDMVIGIVGAFIRGFVFNLIGFSASGLLGSIITATIGAVILLYILSLIKN